MSDPNTRTNPIPIPLVMTTTTTNKNTRTGQLQQQTLPYIINNQPIANPTEGITEEPQPIPPMIRPLQQILLPQHIIQNEPWGDSIYKKPKNTFRIYFQNINGFQPNKPERWDNIVSTIFTTYNSDIGGLCETGLNWKSPTLQRKLQNTSEASLKTRLNFQHSSNKAITATNFLPGGDVAYHKRKLDRKNRVSPQ